MADKNNIADENYLDNLLRAITGETAEETADSSNDDGLDFDNAVKADGSEDEFLSDFEKEFFDESETQMLDDVFGEESKGDDVSDDMLFDLSDGILDDLDEGVSGSTDTAQTAETMNLVEEAVEQGDSSVEEDLQGLYGILGVDENEGGLPENAEDKPKKKGLFGRKDKEKKEKKEKKGKKSKKEEQPQQIEEVSNETLGEATEPALEGFDVEALFNSSDELSLEEPMSMDMGAEESTGDCDFGLDDSGFGGMSENDMLIRQMEEGELDDDELLADEDDGGKKKKGKKDKKEKKEKKAKEKKEKAPKKPKVKKPKKEKEPKEKKPKDPDEVIPVSPVALVLMLSCVVVAVIAAKMGGDYYFYQEKIYEAVELYCDTDKSDIDKYEGRYSEAYSLLSGIEMRSNEHQAFYEQVQTIMFMNRHYEAYKNYMLMEDFDHGLDSLVKAVRMFDKYQNQARDLGCFDDMTVVLSWVNDKLDSTYGINESYARELSMIKDDQEYAVAVRTIAAEAKAKFDALNNVEEE